jgi:hypothetical protein
MRDCKPTRDNSCCGRKWGMGARRRPLVRIVAISVNDRKSAKTRLSTAISNMAVIASAITTIMFGSTDTTRAQIPHINIEETCRAAARAMVGLMGGSTTEQDRNVCLDSEGPRADYQGRSNLFISRQPALHANRRLSPQLCGMARLPRDGKGCEKNTAGRATCNGYYDASTGTAGRQLLDD